MAPKSVTPAINLKSFSCPHCGALADQDWFKTRAHYTDKAEPPHVWTGAKIKELKAQAASSKGEEAVLKEMIPRLERLAQGRPSLEENKDGPFARFDLQNLFVSRCYSCGDTTIWKHDAILYPPVRYEMEPNADLPEDICIDFDEARSVLDLSPRSAAALLRLCIQKICKHLGEAGQNINYDIGSLVKKGLDPRVQKALDVVRVVGNNAVHPGELDLRDDRETAAKLFGLVNRIAFDMITHPKEVDALFADKIPQGAKEQIAKRDGAKT